MDAGVLSVMEPTDKENIVLVWLSLPRVLCSHNEHVLLLATQWKIGGRSITGFMRL